MDTKGAEGGGKLSREEIDGFLTDAGFLEKDGRQIRPLDSEIVNVLINLNGGPYGLNLTARHLGEVELPGKDLQGLIIRGATLSKADLKRANLRDVDMEGANLYGANLTDADLGGSNLRDADLTTALLVGAKFEGADLRDANLTGADLLEADMESAELVGAKLEAANLSRTSMRGASLLFSQLSRAQRAEIEGEPSYIIPEEASPEAAQQQTAQSVEPLTDDLQQEQFAVKEPPQATEEGVAEPYRKIPGRTFAANDEFDGVDRLDMDRYARALARLVLMQESKPPLTIGLYGEWGSGKSALMDLIHKELVSEQEWEHEGKKYTRPLLVVKFNAWENSESQQKLWAGLTQAIVTAMDDRTAKRRRLFALPRNLDFVWHRLMERWPVMAAGVAGIATLVSANTWPGTSTETLTWALTAVGGLFGAPSIVEGWRRGVRPALSKPASARLSLLLKDVTTLEESEPVIKLVGDLLKGFESSLPREFRERRRTLGPWPGGEPEQDGNVLLKTVVFVDDLDRCPPDKIVDVLEGIKLILKEKRFVVFLAVDTRIVSRAIEYRYRRVLQSGQRRPPGELGMEYLAKIVQIPFLLPRPGRSQLEGLLRGRQPITVRLPQSTEGQPGDFERREAVPIRRVDGEPGPDVEDERRRAERVEQSVTEPEREDEWQTVALSDDDARNLVRLAHGVSRNPRTYNRLGNELRLLRLLLHEDDRGAEWQGGRGEQMIKWLVLCDLWPAFGQYLVLDRGLEEADQMLGANRLLEVAQSPSVRGLLRRRYDEPAIDRLHDFLGQEPPLSVEVVRDLVPYTTNLTGIYE